MFEKTYFCFVSMTEKEKKNQKEKREIHKWLQLCQQVDVCAVRLGSESPTATHERSRGNI